MTLRRRARRRLVGAVAIALAAVLILPMLFDPEPRPLGPDVDIRIPAPSTPFEVAPAANAILPETRQPQEPSAKIAEPTYPAAATADERDSGMNKGNAEGNAGGRAMEKGVERPAEKVADKGTHKVVDKAKEKKTAAEKPPAPPLPKPSGAFASQGFYLQLGAFTSENNALQLREKVEAAGFKVGLTDTSGQYRVRVGPIPEKARALEVQAKLRAKGFSSVMLGP